MPLNFAVLFKRDKMRLAEMIFAGVIIQNLIPFKSNEVQQRNEKGIEIENTYIKETNSISSTHTYDYNSSRSNKSN